MVPGCWVELGRVNTRRKCRFSPKAGRVKKKRASPPLDSERPLVELVGLMPVRTAGAGCGRASRVDARQNCRSRSLKLEGEIKS